MMFFKRVLAMSAAAMLFSLGMGYAQETVEQELNERDWEGLRKFLKAKEMEDIADKAKNLSISGDVRFEWRHMQEENACGNIRGKFGVPLKEGVVIGKNDFDIEFNLKLDYDMDDKTWASVHVQYDNSAGVESSKRKCNAHEAVYDCDGTIIVNGKPVGIEENFLAADRCGWQGSGTQDKLNLRRAYMGYNMFDCAYGSLDIELGRRNLYNVFDSRVQFLSRFDGILFHYILKNQYAKEMFLKTAGFIVDERVNHYAWVAEVGVMDILDSGFDFKYSIIDWEKHGRNRCKKYNPIGFRFINSQWSLAYKFDAGDIHPCLCGTPVKLYTALVWNAAARPLKDRFKGQCAGANNWALMTVNNKFSTASYAGITIGEVKKAGDWSVDIQYQVVGAQSVPDGDMGGIGRGNYYDESFTSDAFRGNTNFQGFAINGLYAITDELTINTIVEYSTALYKKLGGKHKYSKLEVEAIYAF